MKCKICTTESRLVNTLPIRNTYNAEYYLCPKCGFLFVGNPTWLTEAYKNSPINITDTGYVLRNLYLSRKTLIIFYFLFRKNHTYLDFAGGYGMLTRLMRDYGLNYYNDDAYTDNLFAKGFEYQKAQQIKAITCFECFEHLNEPLKDIDTMFSISPNIFFSTVLFSGDKAPEDNWEYYGLNHGQHVAFYSKKTLEFLANKYQVNYYTNGSNLHMFSKIKMPNWFFRFLLWTSKVQLDLILRKILKSKTVSDHLELKKQGLI